jgi:hypothetical protein
MFVSPVAAVAVAPVPDTVSGADAADEEAVAGAGNPLPLSNGSTIFLKYWIGLNLFRKDRDPDSFCFCSFGPFFCAKYMFDAFFTFI